MTTPPPAIHSLSRTCICHETRASVPYCGSDDDVLTVMTGSIFHGEQTTSVYRLDLKNEETRSRFQQTEDEDVLGISMSPDGDPCRGLDAGGRLGPTLQRLDRKPNR